MILSIVALVAIAALASFFCKMKKRVEKLETILKAQEKEIKDYMDSVSRLFDKYDERISNVFETAQKLARSTTSQPVENIGSRGSSSAPATSSRREEKGRAASVTLKYCDFAVVETTGTLTVENRDLSDSPSVGWFLVEIAASGNDARYSFNPGKLNEICSNANMLEHFAQPFSLLGKPRNVTVEKKGSMQKKDREWVVTEKMKVKFDY